jgi:hypothetical protein
MQSVRNIHQLVQQPVANVPFSTQVVNCSKHLLGGRNHVDSTLELGKWLRNDS